MKKKRICFTMIMHKIFENIEAKKKLVQFTKAIGEPISYPKLSFSVIKTCLGTWKEKINKVYPPSPVSSVQELMFEAWINKN